MEPWFVNLIDLLIRKRRFGVHIGDDINRWHTQVSGLPQGSGLSLTMFNLYSQLVPQVHLRQWHLLYLPSQVFYWNREHTLRRLNTPAWVLSTVTLKAKHEDWQTVISVFHPHNASAARELSVSIDEHMSTFQCTSVSHWTAPCHRDNQSCSPEFQDQDQAQTQDRQVAVLLLAGLGLGLAYLILCLSTTEDCNQMTMSTQKLFCTQTMFSRSFTDVHYTLRKLDYIRRCHSSLPCEGAWKFHHG